MLNRNRNGNTNGRQPQLSAQERAIQEREARIRDLLPDEDADSLIADAEEIIGILEGELEPAIHAL